MMVKNCMHSSHQISFDIMKGHTLGGTMIDTPLDIDTVIRVPIVLRIRWGLIREVVPGLKRHVALSSCLILCVVGIYFPLCERFELKESMR